MTQRILYEFSGWIEVNPDTEMWNHQNDITISAKEWAALPEDERANYVLKSFVKAYEESNGDGIVDSNWEFEECL